MRNYTLAFVAILAFGCTPVLIKFVEANVFTIGIFRLFIASLLTLIFLNKGIKLVGVSKQQWTALFLIGFFFALHWITYFLSIKLSSATIAITGLSSYGIHLILLGWIAGTKIPRWYDFIAILLAVAGNIIIVPEFSLENENTIGLLVAIFSAFCFAFLPIFQQKNKSMSNATRALGQYSVALVCFLFTLPWTNWELPSSDWVGLLVLAVVCTFVAHTLWIRVTTALPTTTSSVIYYMAIPTAMLLSHIFLGESLGLDKVSGAILIITGNLIAILVPRIQVFKK